MLNLVTTSVEVRQEIKLSLDEIAREGAKAMLQHALKLEVSEYLSQFSELRDDQGKALVVRNGKAQERSVTLGSGTVGITAPRVNDRRPGFKFSSQILPPYLRRSTNVESLLPLLYLKGLSTSDFKSALEGLLGEGTAGLSPASIVSLKKSWEGDFSKWSHRKIETQYAYLWVDGIHVSIRLGDDKRLCLLVILGVAESGEKELLSVTSGYREDTDSWKDALSDLRARGLNTPLLAIGDGALGFWKALRTTDGYQGTKEQRCWVHKIANVLNKLPKRVQPRAKEMLHEIMRSPSKSAAILERKKFEAVFHEKYLTAVNTLTKDWDELTTFFGFPAIHWQHIRTTNVIESTFATVRLRTNVTKGAGSKKSAETMTFKLLQDASKTWRKIRGFEHLKELMRGVVYKDGAVLSTETHPGIQAA